MRSRVYRALALGHLILAVLVWGFGCSMIEQPEQKKKKADDKSYEKLEAEPEVKATSWADTGDEEGDDEASHEERTSGASYDDAEPPSLEGFAAVTGDLDGEIKVTLELPSNTSDYKKIMIKAIKGDEPPASCASGKKIHTHVNFDESEFVVKAPAPGETYSLRACVYDEAGQPAADQPVVKSVVSGTSCKGKNVGGGCWYLAANDESCTTACAAHGGYNELTRTYVGTQGTDAQCHAVLKALGDTLATLTPNTSPDAAELGCYRYELLGPMIFRGQAGAGLTTADEHHPGTRRACACNN